MPKFNRLDQKNRRKTPYVASFVIKRMYDDSPDLSHLQDAQNYKTGEKITFPKEVYPHGFLGVHEWDAREYADKRLETYGSEWHMVGIRAECTFLMPVNSVPPICIMQELTSGGLWGIESDNGKDYIKEVEDGQLKELKEYCKRLGIRFDKNTPVEHKEDN